MSTTVIAGKPSNTVGNKDSTLVLRGSSIKILWGNKFIDLIKNGKINVESDKILKNADSIENVSTDGIYLIEDSVWAVIGGVKIQLSGDSSTTYVSYLTEQETTSELKNRALTNIGFYYDTYEQARNAGLTKGIIYVLGDNKLYIVNNGLLTEYGISSITEEEIINELFIKGYSLLVDNDAYITCKNDSIILHKQLILNNILLSNGASDSTGFRLYMKGGESYLEIDNIILRKLSAEKANIYPTKYYQEENIIINIIRDDITEETELTLLHSEKYKEGDLLITYILLNKEVLDLEGLIKVKQVLIPVFFTILSIEDNIYKVIIDVDSEDEELVKLLIANIHLLKNKSIFYKLGELPVARLLDHNYDLFNALEEQTLENIKTRIGTISEIEKPLLEEKIEKFLYLEDDEIIPILGIYSDNSVLYNSKIILSNIFISETEKLSELSTKIGEIYESILYNEDPNIDLSKYFKNLLRYSENEYNKKLGIYSDNAFIKDSIFKLPEIFISETDKYEELNTRIGEIYKLLELKDLLKYFKEDYNKKLGIYSDNAFLENSTIKLSEIFISETDEFDNITTKIGTLPEKEIQQKPITDFTEKKLGIYSDNAILDEPNLIKANEYAPTFKKLNDTNVYPKYDDTLNIPPFKLDVSHNKVVPNLEWIKELLDSFIPVGTIIMWNGGKVPPGWAICNGSNGTPDLTNRFIKGSAGSVGAINNTEITKENKLTLKLEHLPIHSHPHVAHTHKHNQHRHYVSANTLSGETGSSGSLSMSFDKSNYAYNLKSKEITYVTGYEDLNVSEIPLLTSTTSVINNYSTLGGTTSGGGHTHSVTVSFPRTNTSYTTTTELELISLEQELTEKEYPNKEINILPLAYSLIFIMKISNWKDYKDMIIVT